MLAKLRKGKVWGHLVPGPSRTGRVLARLANFVRADFGRAVSRILSSLLRAERIICLSSQYPGPVPRCGTCSGPLRGPLFGLAPDGVFRASALALGAVGSYSTFSPLPRRSGAVCFLWHCPSASLSTLPPACIPSRLSGTVTRHRALWCSDFPPLPTLSRDRSDSPPFQNRYEYSSQSGGCKRRAER